MLAALLAVALSGIFSGGASPILAQSQSVSSQWTANDDDSWLLDLRSGRYQLGQGVRGYQTETGPNGAGRSLCVDLGDMILALDVPIALDKKSRRATGWLFEERQTLVIDRDAGRVDYAGRTAALTPNMIRDTPEGWCVDVPTLGKWLGITLKPDLSNAVLAIESDRKLPFEVQAERRARAASIKPQGRFDLSTLQGVVQPYSAWSTPSVDVVATTSFTKDARSGSTAVVRYEAFAAAEIGKLSVDARLASDDRGVPNTLRVRAYRSDPDGNLLGPLRATHIGIGDVNGFATPLVSQSAVGRGFVVTNRPLDQPDSYDRTSFRGDLPAGWDAELYRNGQILGFSSGDTSSATGGRYEFLDVPLLYGNNSFEIVLYGPQGQVRRETRVVPVGVESLPPGKTWYWAGVVDEGRDLIQLRRFIRPVERGLRGTFGLERGIGPRTALLAQYHNLLVDGVRTHFAEAAVRQAAGPFLTEFSAAYSNAGSSNTGPVSGYALRGQVLGEIGTTYVRAETIWAQRGFRSDRIDLGVRGLHSVSIDQNVRAAGVVLPVHFEARYIARTSGADSVEFGARVSTLFRNLSLTTQLDWRQQKSTIGPNPADSVQVSLLANARIGRVRVRGEAQFGLAGAAQSNRFSLLGEWGAGGGTGSGLGGNSGSYTDGAQWRAELGYDGASGVQSGRARAGLAYVRHFKPVSLAINAEVASDGSFGAGLNLAFSLGPDPRTRGVRITSQKLASQGQILASVWRDENADGVWQTDERGVPDVVITAGTSLADVPTGKDGATIIDNVAPFRKILIGVDGSSLADPMVQPALAGLVVTPRPGVITRVQLPLVPAGEIEGILMRDGGRTLQGVDLELVDAKGQVRATVRSDYDGYFLFEGAPYGAYSVRIAKISADVTRLRRDLGVQVTLSNVRPRANLKAVRAELVAAVAAVAPEPRPEPVPSDSAQSIVKPGASAAKGISFIYQE